MCKGVGKLKILIITVAGMSSRFSHSLGYSCLKCLYNENCIEESLLYTMIYQNIEFDYYVIVGGFKYEELKLAIEKDFQDIQQKIILVENVHYEEYGSGYSLYLALEKIKDMNFSEVVFAEGDLYVDREEFRAVYESNCDVVTCNTEKIMADKAVAFYFDKQNVIHYIYDIGHDTFSINEPFRAIYNSGQIWKFSNAKQLRETINAMSESEWYGTNLVLIQNYFGQLKREQYEIITLHTWINCNTISDYHKFQNIR